MGKRRLEIEPEEVALRFKRNKFDNINKLPELFVQLKAYTENDSPQDKKKEASTRKQFKTKSGGDSKRAANCIAAIVDMCIKLINDGDIKGTQPLSDDLKNAAQKYKDWAKARFNDVFNYFLQLVHHPHPRVCVEALKALMRMVQRLTLVHCEFPFALYQKVITKILSTKTRVKILFETMKPLLKYEDLSYFTFIALDEVVCDGFLEFPDSFKHNTVCLLLLLRVPPKIKPLKDSPLWCSHRKDKRKKEKPQPKQKLGSNTQGKKSKKKSSDHRKSRYEEVVNQTLNPEGEEEREEQGEEDDVSLGSEDFLDLGDENVEEEEEEDDQVNDKEDLDSEEEQRRLDDEEFKKGKKVKKPRKDKLAQKNEEEEEEGEKEEIEFDDLNKPMAMSAVITPVADEDRLLPKGIFSPVEEEETKEEQEEAVVHKGPLHKHRYPEACELLTKLWSLVMKVKLTEELYKKCLVAIPEHVMEHLSDPVELTDFFMESYNYGGTISLMAMRGVFLLMTKYNLYYPEFYPKLFSLIEPTACDARYKPRFFLLLNVFLSSTHLPEYIAAAFVKGLSRLLLFAPQHAVLLIVKCINNILARFPSLSIMYDTDKITDKMVAQDPFNIGAGDLKLMRACESSLWEVATVSMCAPEKVYKGTQFIKRVGALEEMNISPDLLELDYEDIDRSDIESAEKIAKAATNFEVPEKLLGGLFEEFINFK